MIQRQKPTRLDTYKRAQQTLRLFDFTGGLNTTVDPSLILETQTPYAINCYADTDGIITRPGYTKLWTTSLGATPILGGVKFYKADGTERTLFAHGGNIYQNLTDSSFLPITSLSRAANVVTVTTTSPHGLSTGNIVTILGTSKTSFHGTFTLASGSGSTFTYAQTATNDTATGGKAIKVAKAGLSTTNKYDFCPVILSGAEVMVFSDRAGNLQKYDGTTVSELLAKAGKFPVWHKGRLFIIDPTDKNTLSASVTLNPADFTTVSTDMDTTPYTVSIGKGDGDVVMWLGVVNDNITALKRNSTYVLYSSENAANAAVEQAPSGVGTVASESVGKHKGIIYYAAEDGFYTFDGSLTWKISQNIQPDYDAIAAKSTIVGKCFKGWYYAAYTVSGGTHNTEVLAYNIDDRSWWKFTGMNVNYLIPYIYGDDTEELYFGDSVNGLVYKMFTGTSDNGVAIDMEFRTKYLDMGMPERKKRHRRIYPHFKTQSATTKFGFDHDFSNGPIYFDVDTSGAGVDLGTFVLGTDILGTPGLNTIKLPVTGQARYTQFRVKNNTLNKVVNFLGVSDYWKPRRPV